MLTILFIHDKTTINGHNFYLCKSDASFLRPHILAAIQFASFHSAQAYRLHFNTREQGNDGNNNNSNNQMCNTAEWQIAVIIRKTEAVRRTKSADSVGNARATNGTKRRKEDNQFIIESVNMVHAFPAKSSSSIAIILFCHTRHVHIRMRRARHSTHTDPLPLWAQRMRASARVWVPVRQFISTLFSNYMATIRLYG